ncbi:MAG TPA: tRNA pseudouridine(38-40) synthase TruA [Chthoniobacterales bacterium]
MKQSFATAREETPGKMSGGLKDKTPVIRRAPSPVSSASKVHHAPNESRTQRLKLIIAYDGAGFRGWQSQAGGETIQDRIEEAFAGIAGRKVRIHGAGRTDAGVHAVGQCAHADVPAGKLTPTTWLNALNASLPATIRIIRCRFVSPNFHARFSARGKVYRYHIATGPVLLPFEADRAWHVAVPLDDAAIRACAEMFIGRHDFAGFAANRGQMVRSTVRTIRSVRIRRTSSVTVIDFDADGFLYKMVRLMVGAIVHCGLGKRTLAEVCGQLHAPSSKSVRLVAPAGGLTLVRVHY